MTNKDQRSYNNNVPNAPLAQLVEQVTLNHKVGGSTPLWRTTAKPNINGFAILFLEQHVGKEERKMPKVPKKVEKAIKEFINRNKKNITKPNKRNYSIWFLRKRGL